MTSKKIKSVKSDQFKCAPHRSHPFENATIVQLWNRGLIKWQFVILDHLNWSAPDFLAIV